MTTYLFSKICQEAGLPKGVLNIVHGLGQKLEPITKHPNIDYAFTGGTKQEKNCFYFYYVQKTQLRIGWKTYNIVFADCDLDKAVSTSVLSSFSNQGQICL